MLTALNPQLMSKSDKFNLTFDETKNNQNQPRF